MAPHLVSREDEEGDGGITVGWLLAIALAGGALLFVSLAFILVTLTDRRNQKARLLAESEESHINNVLEALSPDPDSSPTRPRQPRRRLTKSPQVSPGKKQRSSLPHILPHIARSGSLGHLFSAPRKTSKGEAHRRRNSWVDEDAIHGPRMTKSQRESKRISFRESWMMMRTPTLPTLLGYRDESDTEPFYRHQNYPLVPQPRPVALSPQRQQEGQTQQQPVSRMPLVRTPSYELAEQRAAAMRAAEGAQLQPPTAVPNGPRPPPMARLRQVNTESDLQAILRSTAQRLRDGSPSPHYSPVRRQGANMPTRHQRTTSMRGSPIKLRNGAHRFENGFEGEVQYRGVRKTPSPQKLPVQPQTPRSAPAAVHNRQRQVLPAQGMATGPLAFTQTPSPHRRNVSQSSVNSDADSLYGETTPEPEHVIPTGLSSPSRRSSETSPIPIIEPPQQYQCRRSMSVPSMTSSVSSALSTLYSEDEPEDEDGVAGKTALQAPHNQGRHQSWRSRPAFHTPKMSDPFLVVTPAPKVPERSPRRLMVNAPPQQAHQPQQASESSSHGGARALGQISGNSQSVSSSPIMSSLDLAKNEELARREELRLSIMMAPPNMPGQQNMRPKSVVTMKPTLFATSASVVSMAASPSTPEEERKRHKSKASSGARSAVMPPPLNLRPIEGSPRSDCDGDYMLPTAHLNNQRAAAIVASESMDDVVSLPSSPPPNRPLPDPHMLQQSPTPIRIRRTPAGSHSPCRGLSNASNSSSRYSASEPGPRDRDSRCNSPHKEQDDSPSLVLRSTGTVKRNSPTHVSPLQSSIVQLRRMNSQISSYSMASSAGSDQPESPILPDFRNASPNRNSNRLSRVGRQNYLSLGTPSPKSQRSIKNARNSILGISPPRPGSALRLEPPTETMGEGKENESDARTKERNRDGEVLPPVTTTTTSIGGRGGELKGSLRNSQSPKRRLSVRFGGVKEHVFVDETEIVVTVTEEPPQRGRTSNRASVESLGLYDKDGFLMSSPDRLPSSVAEGRQGGGGLRI